MHEESIAKLMRTAAVGVLPTDTVYGLVARASDQAAVARLYKLKSRQNKPGTLIASSIDQLVELGIKYRYLKAVEQFFYKTVSVIIPCGPELAYLHLGVSSLAVRIPNLQGPSLKMKKLLHNTGPLLTTSANLPGRPPATTIANAKKYFDDRVDFYVDGGDLSGRKPSTIIRIIDDAVEVLRQGAVKIKDNEAKQ